MVLLATLTGLLGLAIGSFLNVVVHRVPRGESVVHPPSACPRCERRITARDNVPLVSWILLRGRCRGCALPISARYPLVELLTAVLFAVVTLVVGFSWALPAYLYLVAIAVALAAIDIDVHRLPDAIVLPSYLVAAVLLGIAGLAEGDGQALLRAAVGGAAMFALYGLSWFLYPRGMGLGDVKLAGVLGLYLGWWSWSALAVGTFGAFVLGGVGAVVVVLTRDGGRRTRIPFGPYMLASALAALVVAAPVAGWYLQLVGLAPTG
ncbi:prepilin peptidase [Kineococcus rhizosphaerae]|uniref:Leader peptidase (Prepilin peptidase)/N-methyltransferase n=1 Tax=Kineococcus rhizosphaerae TaxID=559628 RepID=A0A2T0R9U7_9ACTN|nr:A24 family peptidase [Kineococcus rhizosphaerae]PRY17910.1 leader peptidase (prepilin peptidase)/N-methyltransferase [Kineococcus rhizosphaerae]